MRKIILPLFLVIGAGVIALTVLSIIMVPKPGKSTNYGIGADGFRAYVEEKSDLGVRSLVDKQKVVAALGNRAKSVGDEEVSKVFNYNGDRSQTVTYRFVRTDDVASTLYVDMKLYKNAQSLEKDNIYVATLKTDPIGGHPAYFKHAQTIDGKREYHMIVVNGLKAYRFVVAQPYKNVTLSEVVALSALKRLAADMKL